MNSPPIYSDICKAVEGFIAERVINCQNPVQIAIGQIQYTGRGVVITATVSHYNTLRSPCTTVDFFADIADPEFFTKLDKYLNGCFSLMK